MAARDPSETMKKFVEQVKVEYISGVGKLTVAV